MAECSLDLIFFKLETDHFFLVGGQGLIFSNSLKLDFFIDKVKVFFCNTIVYNCY